MGLPHETLKGDGLVNNLNNLAYCEMLYLDTTCFSSIIHTRGGGVKPIVRVLLIVYIVEAAAMAIAGLVISLVYDFYSGVGLTLLFIGLFQLFVGVWLFKRRGKGILG